MENEKTGEIDRILKVGYAKDVNNRMGSYKMHNPGFKLLGTRKGTKTEERCFHLYLRFLGYRLGDFREWFVYDKEVVKSFKKSDKEIKKFIWDNRNSIWEKSDFTFRKEDKEKEMEILFGELKEKYHDAAIYPQYEIDEFFESSKKNKLEQNEEKNIVSLLECPNKIPDKINSKLNDYLKAVTQKTKLKYFCKLMDFCKEENFDIMSVLRELNKDIEPIYFTLYTNLGTLICEEENYEERNLKKRLKIWIFEKSEIVNTYFKIGKIYTNNGYFSGNI